MTGAGLPGGTACAAVWVLATGLSLRSPRDGRDLFLAENILPALGRPVACPFPGVALLPVLREATLPPGSIDSLSEDGPHEL
jgi:hypothetical protein